VEAGEVDFGELYEHHARDVYRFSLFLSGDHAVADDLTAETFARALAGRDNLRLETVRSYLLAIARNLFRDTWRQDRRYVALEPRTERIDPRPGADVATEGRERLRRVLDAIGQLPVAEREALVLAVDRELPYHEIAAIVGTSVPAVKVRVHRARARLKSLLAEKEQP
jgi:RNA polymerase sigma-70 factor (ECF subfamily)